jgi:hypothetical protein
VTSSRLNTTASTGRRLAMSEMIISLVRGSRRPEHSHVTALAHPQGALGRPLGPPRQAVQHLDDPGHPPSDPNLAPVRTPYAASDHEHELLIGGGHQRAFGNGKALGRIQWQTRGQQHARSQITVRVVDLRTHRQRAGRDIDASTDRGNLARIGRHGRERRRCVASIGMTETDRESR